MLIDAHHHFWHPARGDYGWMPQDDPVLSRRYGPADLSSRLALAQVGKTVLVQAAPTVGETEYLLGLADAAPHVAAVVGWIDFEDPSQRDQLHRWAAHPKFVGVRPMIQDLPDDNWMLRPDIQWAFEALIELDLTFDGLGFPQHITPFLTLLKRHPEMRVVLDHCLKPQIGGQPYGPDPDWAQGMAELAQQTSAYCKLSGLVTEAEGDPSDAKLKPYVDHILQAFGPERVMWGSDWPVLRLKSDYAAWHAQARRLCAHLSPSEQAEVFGKSAARFYRIPEGGPT